ncbi:MAG: lipoyl synthase [Trichloromonadaceae bacterium]
MPASNLRKPDWLKVRFGAGPAYARIERLHREAGLHSVCRSAACPNQGECWSRGTATFMILGDSCSRDCAFCNVRHGSPAPLDPAEPQRVAAAIALLQLRHAVITSVTRDDLEDGGATVFAELTRLLRAQVPNCRIELLIPDLGGRRESLATLLGAPPDVLGHNLETVPRLYPQVRQGADYQLSLTLLAQARDLAPQLLTKSGLMLGLGETREEILQVCADLARAGVSLLTLGQYLAPTRRHHPVERYLPPEEFAALRQAALQLGFAHVEAGPLVRSSYHADQAFEGSCHDHR